MGTGAFERYQRGEPQPGLLGAEAFGRSPGAVTPGAQAFAFQLKACRLVFDYVKNRLDKSDPDPGFTEESVYVVWFSKTLQNWKAMVSTTLPDGMYYEVTYNGDKHETYLDVYKKFENVCIPDEE
jgi:hypothetical protein